MKLDFFRRLPKDKLQKIVLVCIATLCAVVGVVQFYALKNWAAFEDAKNQIGKLNDQIQQAEHEAQQAAQDGAYRQQVTSFVEAQRTWIIEGDPFAWVVREVSLLAEKHPVHVDALRSGKIEPSGKSKCSTYTARIEFSGTYDQIGAFVRDLENKFPTSEIRALSISGSSEDKGQLQAAADLTFRVLPEPTAKSTEANKTS
ncbi:MAG TPA: hypothetical protein VL486_14285 [Verrucomicrobiae bacterium]|nr:hypothetical protein [Verrucomicrobiae bacterium]